MTRLCKNCKHCKLDWIDRLFGDYKFARCTRTISTDKISGQKEYGHCFTQRSFDHLCSSKGKYFKSKVKK